MTVEEKYIENMCKSFESSQLISEESGKGFHPTDTKLRVNEEEVTFTILNAIVVDAAPKILRARSKINAIVKGFIAKNSSKLGARYPSTKIIFTESDKNAVFNAVGIKREDLAKVIKQVDANDIDTSNHLFADEFVSMCVIIAGVFLRNDKKLLQKIKDCDRKPLENAERYNDTTSLYYIILYLSIRLYGALYVKFWKYDPNEQVMDYTMESLSGKFLMKKMNNMLEFLQYCSDTNVENMWDRLTRLSDVDIFYFASNLNNRISHALRMIAQKYYEDFKNNNKIGSDDANKTDPSTGKSYTGDVASISGDLVQSVRKVINAFYSESIIDPQLLTMACNRTKLSQSRMLLILKSLRENRKSEPRIKSLFNDIISYYLTSLGGKINELRSSKFAVAMIKAYSVSNTKDPFVLGVKDNLNGLINENLQTIVDCGNGNLVDRVRNSVYTYFVLFIAKSIE